MQIMSRSTNELSPKVKNELRIANEIYLSERLVKIHYADVMDIVPIGTSTKDSLVAWLNDSVRKGELVRVGIVNLYKTDRPEHFVDGKWKPEHFADFVEYALKKLTDRYYIKDDEIRWRYLHSVQSVDWFEKACPVIGLKLLESLYLEEELASEIANIRMNMNFNTRILLEKNGRILGRVGKNNDWKRDTQLGFNKDVEEYYRKQFELSKLLHADHEEYLYLEKHRDLIVRSLAERRLNVIEGSSVQLTINLE